MSPIPTNIGRERKSDPTHHSQQSTASASLEHFQHRCSQGDGPIAPEEHHGGLLKDEHEKSAHLGQESHGQQHGQVQEQDQEDGAHGQGHLASLEIQRVKGPAGGRWRSS